MSISNERLKSLAAKEFSHAGTNSERVLLVHSFTGTPAQVHKLATRLATLNYSVSAPLLSGHGTKLEDLEGVGREEWMADVKRAASVWSDIAPTLHIVGTSMGGLLAIHAAPELRPRSLTLINTPIRFRRARTYAAPILRFVRRFHRWAPQDTGEGMPNSDLRIQYDGYAMGALAAFVALSVSAWRKIRLIDTPTLVVQTRNDPDTDPASANILAKRLRSPHRAVLWLDDTDHEALLSEHSDEVESRIIEHIGAWGATP